MDHHQTLSPSKFPQFDLCPRYISGHVGEAANRGSIQHKYIESVIMGSEYTGDALTANEFGNCEYALQWIVENTTDGRIVEERLNLVEDFEVLTFGTADVLEVFSDHILLIDYKSGEERDYSAQMAVYARAAMQKYGKKYCKVVELYGRLKKTVEYGFFLSNTDFVLDIAKRVLDESSKENPNEYCKWCAKFPCDACQKNVQMTIENRNEAPLVGIKNWHPSEVTDPEQMALLIQAADIAKAFVDSVDHHKKIMALEQKIPGYELVTYQSKKFADDVSTGHIFAASGLSPDEFVDCCNVTVGNLREKIANQIGMKGGTGKKAKEEFNSRFGALLVDSETTKFIKERKTK